MNPLRQQTVEILQSAIRQTTGSAARLCALGEAEETSADRYASILARLRELADNESILPLLDEASEVANERVRRCEQISTRYQITRRASLAPIGGEGRGEGAASTL